MTGAPTIPGQVQSLGVVGTKPLYHRQDFGGTIGGPLEIPHLYAPLQIRRPSLSSEEFRLEKTPTEYNQAVPSLKERGLIMTSQGVQPNLVPGLNGTVYQDFDFNGCLPAARDDGTE